MLGWWLGWLVGVLTTVVLGQTVFHGLAVTSIGVFFLLLILYVIIDLVFASIGAIIQTTYREHHNRR